MTMRELDDWYKQHEAALDDLRAFNWPTLSHAKKLEIYLVWKKQVAEDETRQSAAARAYHALPQVIAYFKENKLLHESGDYREQT